MDAVAAVPASDDTFPKLFLRNAKMRGGRPAMRQKDFGIWQTWTWAECSTRCAPSPRASPRSGSPAATRSRSSAPTGRSSTGRSARLSRSAPCRCRSMPISVADEMAYVLEHAEVVAAVVEDQEQVDKLLAVAERLPALKHDRL